MCVELAQRLADQLSIGRVAILNQRPLHFTFTKGFGHINRFPGKRIFFNMVHDSGQGQGKRNEILNLLGVHFSRDQVTRHLQGTSERRTGMGADKIVDQKSPRGKMLPHPSELGHKRIISSNGRFAHGFEHLGLNMLRRDFHASTDMETAKLLQTGIGPVVPEQIMAKSAADKRMFDPWQGPEATVKGQALGVPPDRGSNRSAVPYSAGCHNSPSWTSDGNRPRKDWPWGHPCR